MSGKYGAKVKFYNNALVVSWWGEGFGEVTVYRSDDVQKIYIDTEYISEEMLTKIIVAAAPELAKKMLKLEHREKNDN